MEKPLIVANWKMNPPTLGEAKRLFNSIKERIKNFRNVEVVICPPFVYLPGLEVTGFRLKIGGQDCFWEEKGAFTGEVSPRQLKNLGCQYVILGHSERRRYLKETDEMIDKKIKAAIKEKLKPILCIEHPSQVKKEFKNIIIAYEPVSAIGTGIPYNIGKAKKMRKSLNQFSQVLYGGSVKAKNAKDYLQKAGFQGLLVGGASLEAEEFIKLVKKVSRD